MNELDKITENIRIINPEITDELLDLLYEYITTKLSRNIENSMQIDT